jgi:predicted amidohydrolase
MLDVSTPKYAGRLKDFILENTTTFVDDQGNVIKKFDMSTMPRATSEQYATWSGLGQQMKNRGYI